MFLKEVKNERSQGRNDCTSIKVKHVRLLIDQSVFVDDNHHIDDLASECKRRRKPI